MIETVYLTRGIFISNSEWPQTDFLEPDAELVAGVPGAYFEPKNEEAPTAWDYPFPVAEEPAVATG